VQEGSVGAGAGATVGKLGGAGRSTQVRPGTPPSRCRGRAVVAAIVAVNAVGDIINPATGQVVAGVRNPDGTFADARKMLRSGGNTQPPRPGENTTIGLVATNATLSKSQATRMALMADDGYARAISPSHTNGDGDTIFPSRPADGTAPPTSPSLARSRRKRWPTRSSAPRRAGHQRRRHSGRARSKK
jgi:L-aminopeptidase/D-esterase-like protein